MASKKRDFQAGIPAAVTFRWVLRLDLFQLHDLRMRFIQLIAKWAVEADVAVLAFNVRPNHAHMILCQRVDGCWARVGISAMMRNVLSQAAIAANRLHSFQGHAVERTYRSVNLPRARDLLRQLAYLHSQGEHHGSGPDWEDLDSHPIYYDGAVDGITTHIVLPDLDDIPREQRAERLVELLEAIAQDALAREALAAQDANPNAPDLTACERAHTRFPWLDATNEAVDASPLAITIEDHVSLLELVPITSFRDAEAHEQARQTLLDWRMPYCLFHPRRAPRVGELIDIRVTVVPHPPAAPPGAVVLGEPPPA